MDRSTFLAQLHQRFELPLSAMTTLVEHTTGLQIAEVHRLVRGDENEVYRVRLVTGSVVFVRAGFPDCPPGKLNHEAEVMQRARAEGVPAPAVRAVESLATEQGTGRPWWLTKQPEPSYRRCCQSSPRASEPG